MTVSPAPHRASNRPAPALAAASARRRPGATPAVPSPFAAGAAPFDAVGRARGRFAQLPRLVSRP